MTEPPAADQRLVSLHGVMQNDSRRSKRDQQLPLGHIVDQRDVKNHRDRFGQHQQRQENINATDVQKPNDSPVRWLVAANTIRRQCTQQ